MGETQKIGKVDDIPVKEEPEDSTYNHIVKYTGFLGLIQALTMLVSVVRNKLAAVLLHTTGVGLSSLFYTLIGFLHQISNLGISFSSIKEIAEYYGQGDRGKILRQVEVVRTWGIWTGLSGTLLCLLFSPFISWVVFKDMSHISQICLLSPAIGFMSVTVGELSILKAVRRLKRVAVISVLSAVVTLLLTVPFYYFWGIWGIVPALLVSTFGTMVMHLALSLPVFPWRVDLRSKDYLKKGESLIRLGVPYILAGTANISIALGISLFIAGVGSLSDVGLYGMGYNLVFTYAGVVFTAVDTDYFPRLSSVNADRVRMNLIINRQIKVCALLMSPFLVVFTLSMPLVVRLLYTSAFLPMVGMAICASLHMFFKAMTLPVAYISLAKGDALTYLCMEVVYDIVMAALVGIGYFYWGILGTGVALALAGIFDWWLIYWNYGRRYGFQMEKSMYSFLLCQFVCVTAALVLGLQSDVLLKVIAGAVALFASIWFSFRILRREITLFSDFKAKFKRKFSHR